MGCNVIQRHDLTTLLVSAFVGRQAKFCKMDTDTELQRTKGCYPF